MGETKGRGKRRWRRAKGMEEGRGRGNKWMEEGGRDEGMEE